MTKKDKLMNHLIEACILWAELAPDAHKSNYTLDAPNGTQFSIDIVRTDYE